MQVGAEEGGERLGLCASSSAMGWWGLFPALHGNVSVQGFGSGFPPHPALGSPINSILA